MVFTTEEVKEAINNLNQYSSPGPDKIHPLIIINCCESIVNWLTDLFNLSIKLGVFPKEWKLSYISPFFKSGDITDVSNYRPINKYNVLAKLFDCLVYTKMFKYFRKFIVENQHGFINGRSTVTNLAIYSEYIYNHLNNSVPVDSIYTDFSRAFDVVNLNLLGRKLEAYGIGGSLLRWFESYLNGRKQIVKIGSFISDIIDVLSGVGQGTHLGPLLFLIFINDIVNSVSHSQILLFADDMKLFRAITVPSDVYLLQQDLDSVMLWCVCNGFECNPKKCHSLSFGRHRVNGNLYSLNDVPLDSVDYTKDLGVIFDSKMTFKNHIEYLDIKVRKKIYFIKRFSVKFNSVNTFRSLYFSFVYSRLMYASTIWRPSTKQLINKIEAINTLYLRFAVYRVGSPMSFLDHDFSKTYKKLSISTLESARDKTDIIFAAKIFSNNFDSIGLLEKFSFYVPPRILRTNNYIFDYSVLRPGQKQTIIMRLSEICNNNSQWFDPGNVLMGNIKNNSLKLLKYE